MNRARVENLIRDLLAEVGALPNEALAQTPNRVARNLEAFTAGYRGAAGRPAAAGSLTRMQNGLTVARDLTFVSLCEHHLLPFFGVCHLGCAAPGRRVDLEELGQIVDTYARRLQLQERLTDQIAREVTARLSPQGVAVAVEARHLCMMMRGVGKQTSTVSTSSVLGSLRESPSTRAEFFSLVGAGRPRGLP